MSSWYLLSLFFHLIGLILWLGAIVFFLVVFAPAVHHLEPGVGMRTLNYGRSVLEAASWAGIALLLVSGITNLILRNEEFGIPQNHFYMIALSVKLLLFVAMVVHHGLQVFKYRPKIESLTTELPAFSDAWPEPLLTYWRKWFLLLKINAALGPIVTLLGVALVKT
ncbi:MAG TPA: hypothetical protein VEG60_26645 [Candidatus Binatia bacterium]|nr:hypothetical protein [Candidatus Binatia bacterium]